MTIKMEALRTFVGAEGFILRGESFEVKDMTRANQLIEVELAKFAQEEEKLPFADDDIFNDEQPINDGEVRLIEPVHEPVIVENPTELNDYQIVFTGEPEETNNPPDFEAVVRYLGGGWYELPNNEKVQGKESARDLYEAYTQERRDM